MLQVNQGEKVKEDREDKGYRGREKRNHRKAYGGEGAIGAKEGEDEEKTHQRKKAGTKRGMEKRGKTRCAEKEWRKTRESDTCIHV